MDSHETSAKYNLAETCCASVSIDELCSLSERASAPSAKSLLSTSAIQNYGHIRGNPSLLAHLSRLYSSKVGTPLPSEHILITPGAIAANFLTFYALLGPGDHVVCHYPTYQQLYSVPESLGAEVSLWRSRPEKEWLPDFDELQNMCRESTKMIILKFARSSFFSIRASDSSSNTATPKIPRAASSPNVSYIRSSTSLNNATLSSSLTKSTGRSSTASRPSTTTSRPRSFLSATRTPSPQAA